MPPYINISVGGKAPRSMVPVPVSRSPISILDGGTAISIWRNNSLTNDLDKGKIHLDMLIYAHESDDKELIERARDRFLKTLFRGSISEYSYDGSLSDEGDGYLSDEADDYLSDEDDDEYLSDKKEPLFWPRSKIQTDFEGIVGRLLQLGKCVLGMEWNPDKWILVNAVLVCIDTLQAQLDMNVPRLQALIKDDPVAAGYSRINCDNFICAVCGGRAYAVGDTSCVDEVLRETTCFACFEVEWWKRQ
jgi:hypothetical protein